MNTKYFKFDLSYTQSIFSEITKNENDQNVSQLEITEAVLIYCNIVNKDYQQNSRVLHTFFQNKSFGQLLYISPKRFIFLKTLDLEFFYIGAALKIKAITVTLMRTLRRLSGRSRQLLRRLQDYCFLLAYLL